MTGTERTARQKLGTMLTRLWETAGPSHRQTLELGISPSTHRGWREGKTAPSAEKTGEFWSLVRQLQEAVGGQLYTDAEWETALRAAQGEGTRNKYRPAVPVRREHSRIRFARPHRLAIEAAMGDIRGREGERTAMNAFVRDSSSTAPSYLCWHAEAPVGKTVLLADYVMRPPRGPDVLNFFVSAAHRTNTRAEFEEHMTEQIETFLGSPPRPAPRGVRQWRRLFAEAAEESVRHGRKLLLVVDGLDDDVAWPGIAADGEPPATGGTARQSIAALLPMSPPPGMRVIVSFRRCVRFPDDLPTGHPLRLREHLRALAPIGGVPQVRQTPPAANALGGTVVGLLAAAGGGLRTADLAELAGLPADRLDRLVQGPEGRSLVLEDPVFQTYALADPGLAQAVREGLGDEETARHTRALLAWSQRWRTAGWPEGTPPYPLAHQLRLLTDSADRAAYVLDMSRLRRLAVTAGSDAALAQLDAFEEEVKATATNPGSLTVLAPLTVARALLRGETREVPPAPLPYWSDWARPSALAAWLVPHQLPSRGLRTWRTWRSRWHTRDRTEWMLTRRRQWGGSPPPSRATRTPRRTRGSSAPPAHWWR